MGREQHIATARVQERKKRINHALKRASFVRITSKYTPDINYPVAALRLGSCEKCMTTR